MWHVDVKRETPAPNFPPIVFSPKVFLSKQQTTDLSGKVQDLLLQKDAIERLGIDDLRAQLARTKAVRQKASVGYLIFSPLCSPSWPFARNVFDQTPR